MEIGRVVVITGGAGGIGSALVDRFLRNGDRVVATDLGSPALERLGSRFARSPEELAVVAADVTQVEGCEAVKRAAADLGGRVDILINCAGSFPLRPFEEITLAEWRQVVDVNLTGTFLMIQTLLPLMKDHGWGRIVNFSSGTFFRGPPNLSHYVAAKAGVLGLTRCLATELGDYGITVNAVLPGLTVTDAIKRNFPDEFFAMQRGQRPLKRDQIAEDMVGPVFFLASPAADFMTGQALNVDGGSVKY